MFSFEEAQYLLNIPKKIEDKGILKDSIAFTQPFPFTKQYKLISLEVPDYIFIYDIKQSSKNQFKLTLYLFDDDTKIGLLRVDYNGQHKNPEIITVKVPQIFHPYKGMFFDYHDHHIHYYVEGYKTTLDWAIPLRNDTFRVKDITSPSDILEAFYAFNETINLITIFQINPLLL
jgi:hypothetical protein